MSLFPSHDPAGDNTSDLLGDWVDTQFGSDYIIKVYKNDPSVNGVQLPAAGSGNNDTWFFDYAAGVLNFNGDNVPTGVLDTNIYIVAYRYVGDKGYGNTIDTAIDYVEEDIATLTRKFVSVDERIENILDNNKVYLQLEVNTTATELDNPTFYDNVFDGDTTTRS